MREKMIAGNWKMHTSLQEGTALAQEVANGLKGNSLKDKKVILIPPFLHLAEVARITADVPNTYSGAQNCHFEKEGAFTGEVSTHMLKQAGVSYVIIGHSERRQYFCEDNVLLNKKVKAALQDNITPIYCCGETLEEREAGKHFEIVEKQVSEGLFNLIEIEIKQVVVAYEPVWAIGTGKTASPEQAQEIHAFIRGLFEKKYGQAVAASLIILYGGSVKPANAAELFGQADIDGGLVGGASLKAADFLGIINAI